MWFSSNMVLQRNYIPIILIILWTLCVASLSNSFSASFFSSSIKPTFISYPPRSTPHIVDGLTGINSSLSSSSSISPRLHTPNAPMYSYFLTSVWVRPTRSRSFFCDHDRIDVFWKKSSTDRFLTCSNTFQWSIIFTFPNFASTVHWEIPFNKIFLVHLDSSSSRDSSVVSLGEYFFGGFETLPYFVCVLAMYCASLCIV